MKHIIFSGWNFIRVLRLVLGIIVVGQGGIEKDWMIVAAGILFSLTAVFNIGCCGVSGCHMPVSKKNDVKTGEVIYEEIH